MGSKGSEVAHGDRYHSALKGSLTIDRAMSAYGEPSRSGGRVGPDEVAWGPRILGLLALAASLIALFVVITTSTGSDDGSVGTAPAAKGEKKKSGGGAEKPKKYAVQPGDTLSGIAAKFDVSTKRLLRLNPGIDPQALATGTELKIR